MHHFFALCVVISPLARRFALWINWQLREKQQVSATQSLTALGAFLWSPALSALPDPKIKELLPKTAGTLVWQSMGAAPSRGRLLPQHTSVHQGCRRKQENINWMHKQKKKSLLNAVSQILEAVSPG